MILHFVSQQNLKAGKACLWFVTSHQPCWKRAKNARTKGHDLGTLDWVVGDAMALPFDRDSFDFVTMGFGLRNVVEPSRALGEIYRVLRPGGRFFCLEFSKVSLPILDKAYKTFAFQIIPFLSHLVARDRESYQYLVESIQQFPRPR